MSDHNDHRPARPSLVPPGKGEHEYPPEYFIARTLHQRLVAEKLVREGEAEPIAYRIAEIMVAAKDLYTVSLPRLTTDRTLASALDPEHGGEQLGLYEELAGLRMALLHMRDLVSEFDAHFMDAMAVERNHDERPPEWENPDDEDVDWGEELRDEDEQ